MKTLVLLSFILMSSGLAQAQESEGQEESKWRRRCECSVTDWDRGHYYGSSNRSAEEAVDRAFRDCYNRTLSPGTCEVARYDFCGCRY